MSITIEAGKTYKLKNGKTAFVTEIRDADYTYCVRAESGITYTKEGEEYEGQSGPDDFAKDEVGFIEVEKEIKPILVEKSSLATLPEVFVEPNKPVAIQHTVAESFLNVAIEKYTKKPIEIKAIRLTVENIYRVAEWCKATEVTVFTTAGGNIKIATLEGIMQADIGDFIIQGIKGEFYPCKADIFIASYDKTN